MNRILLVCVVAAAGVLTAAARAQEPKPAPRTLADLVRELQQAPVAAAPAEGVAVRVVDGDGQPVVGALVAATPQRGRADLEDLNRRMMELAGDDRDEAHTAVASLLVLEPRYRTDAAGKVLVPAEDGSRLLAVAFDEAGGVRTGRAKVVGGKATLTVFAELVVRVRAVDDKGRPVGGLDVRIADDPRPATVSTDARGEATLRVSATAQTTPVLRLVAELDLPENPFVEFPRQQPPAEPVVLRVPPTGLLRVIAYGDDERPRTDVERVGVCPVEAHRDILFRRRGVRDPSGSTFRVPLGARYQVSVTVRGVTGALPAECDGPTQPGELVVCDVRATQGPPTLVFVVRGRDGEPCRERQLQYEIRTPNGITSSGATTDRDGVVRFALPPNQFPAELTLLAVTDGTAGDAAAGGVRFTPTGLHAGENRLADVRLVEVPLWLAGTVLDAQGQPVANARVSCRSTAANPGDRQTPEADAVTAADGTFAVRGFDEPQELLAEVRASQANLGRVSQTFAFGSEAKITLPTAVAVRFVAAELPETNRRLARLYVTQGKEAPIQLDLKGPSTSRWLTPGDYVFELTLSEARDAVARVPFQVAADAAECQVTVPWAEHFALVTATVVDTAGQPVRGAMVMNRTGRGWSGSGETDADGKTAVLVPKAGGALRAMRMGSHLPAEATGVCGDVTLTLTPMLPIGIRVTGLASTPELDSMSFFLRGAAGKVPPAHLDCKRGNPMQLTGSVAEPGDYALILQYGIAEPGRGAHRIRQQSLGTVTIPADGDRTAIEFAWTKELAALITDLEQQTREANGKAPGK